MIIISTDRAPAAVGPYSQAIVTGGMVYTSGQIPIDPADGNLVGGGIVAQTEQTIKNIETILQAAGSDLTRVVKTTCYLADMGDFAPFNATYEKYFTGKPARSCIGSADLPKGALIEIGVIAEL